jgi:hypothetical protein
MTSKQKTLDAPERKVAVGVSSSGSSCFAELPRNRHRRPGRRVPGGRMPPSTAGEDARRYELAASRCAPQFCISGKPLYNAELL